MAPQAPCRTFRALIVEDEQIVTAMIVSVLHQLDIAVPRSATTKSEAMKLLTDSEAIDIALVDINLDVAGGGIEVAKEAAARGLHVIIITGSDRVPADMAGHALLLKPFSVDHLKAIVTEARQQLSAHSDRDG